MSLHQYGFNTDTVQQLAVSLSTCMCADRRSPPLFALAFGTPDTRLEGWFQLVSKMHAKMTIDAKMTNDVSSSGSCVTVLGRT